MQEGAFALIDCLGWKGIWKDKDDEFPKRLFEKISQIEDLVRKELRQYENSEQFSGYDVYTAFNRSILIDDNIKPVVRFLSDTVIVGIEVIKFDEVDDKNIQRAWLIDLLCIILTKITDLFIEDEPHLAMRGCVSYGKFSVERNFILGEAVDWAAEGENFGKGAFIWLHKSAENYFDAWYKSIKVGDTLNKEAKQIHLDGNIIIKYKMPCKTDNLDCYILNPLANFESEEKRDEVIEIYRKSMNK